MGCQPVLSPESRPCSSTWSTKSIIKDPAASCEIRPIKSIFIYIESCWPDPQLATVAKKIFPLIRRNLEQDQAHDGWLGREGGEGVGQVEAKIGRDWGNTLITESCQCKR